MLPHVKLTDDSFILQTSTGPVTITTRSFNYHKILKLLEDPSTTLPDIEPLLVIPPLPDGTFYAYDTKDNDLVYLNVGENSTGSWHHILPHKTNVISERNYLGVFASVEDIKLTFPEYLV